jgi:hypothetical protein
MFINGLMYKVNEEKRKQERMKAAKSVAVELGVAAVLFSAVGIVLMTKKGRLILEKMINKAGNTSDVIQDRVIKTVSTVKHAGATALNDVQDSIEDFHKKTEQIIDDVNDGNQNIADDIQKTGNNISDDLR